LRILLASDFFPPAPGGLEAHVRRLAEALIEQGHEVAVVTGTAQPAAVPGATLVPAQTVLSYLPGVFRDSGTPFPPPLPDAIFRRAVRGLAERWKPDVIHAHGWCAFSCYWPGSPPLVVTLHDHGLRCPKRTLLRDNAECRTGRGLNCITCKGAQPVVKRSPLAAVMGFSVARLTAHVSLYLAVSQSVADRATETGLDPAKVQVVPNFIDVPSAPAAGSPVSDPSDAPSGPPTVLFVGPDSPHKGRAVLIDAFRRLPPGYAQVALVGSSIAVDLEGVSTLGFMQQDSLREQYQKASVLVVPSLWPEPCPTVILEAMTHGLPVIGTRIGGIPDLVDDGTTGLLVPPNDAVALADALRRLLDDRDLHHRLSACSQARVRQFSTEAVVPAIEDAYRSALKAAAP
jgi:glycosyltransferase involved in cell wall biosynthesis